MQMSLRTVGSMTLAAGVCAAVLLLPGCSAHQAPPATPVDTAATPTFRSSSNSYDQPNTPMYTQPGQNGGTPGKMTPIPTANRFDQNAPLALAVYGALQQGLGAQSVKYLTAQSKGGVVELGGTAPTAAVASQAKSIATKQNGVKQVVDKIKVVAA
jgi:osmotically-inducible protein OsmY